MNENPSDKRAVVAFRTDPATKKMIEAVAARRDELPSDWLRRTTRRAVGEELSGEFDGRDAAPRNGGDHAD